MFRSALNDLKQWLSSKSRNPLVIRGARQVGKTWLVRELARCSHLELIEINFELTPAKKTSLRKMILKRYWLHSR